MNIFEKKIITVVILGSEQLINNGSQKNFKISFSRFSREEITSVKKLYEIYWKQVSTTDFDRQKKWSEMIKSSIVDLPLNAYISYIKLYMKDQLHEDVDVNPPIPLKKQLKTMV